MMEFTASRKLADDIPPVLFALQSQNIGNTSIKGFEISFLGQGKINDFMHQYWIGYTFIDPKYQNFDSISRANTSSDTINVLKYRFRHTIKWDSEFGYKKFSFGFAVIYNSNMEAIDKIFDAFLPDVNAFRAAHNAGFATLDVRAAYKITDKTKITLLLANATNTEYSYRPALLEAPRSIQFRFDQKF